VLEVKGGRNVGGQEGVEVDLVNTRVEDAALDFKDLVLRMLSYDPAARPTIEEVQNHPWMKKRLIIEQSEKVDS